MAIIAGIDVGTQSTKVVVYDEETKTIIGSASRPHEIIAKSDGSREQEVSWWTDAIRECFLSIDSSITLTIDAIGVSGQQHGFVPLDKDGNALYRAKLWNDTSTAKECDEITLCAGGNETLLETEGNLILPGYTISKILWFKKNKPDLYKKMEHILLPHDYINYYLTGNYTCERGDSSGTGLLNVHTMEFSSRLASCIDKERDILSLLPKRIENSDLNGIIKDEIASLYRLKKGVVVSSGGGDNMMGAIGTGTVKSGTLTVSLGTSGTIFACSDKPLIDKNGYLAAFCSSTDQFLPLLCTMNCTVATELTRTLFNRGVKEADEIASSAPIGCDGLTFLPYFNGERTPNYPYGKGTLIGLNQDNMKEAHIARSALEAAIYSLRLGSDTFKAMGYDIKEIRLIGGGAASRIWRQMCADIFNTKVVIPTVSEAAAFGSALQALWAYKTHLGEKVSIEGIVATHVTIEEKSTYLPDPMRVEEYEKAYRRFLRYMDGVKEMFSTSQE
ncbi:MAG: xylulokinase [Spirochaetia bacterium]|nr:xylulokinase [Spirochaetia bacterium]